MLERERQNVSEWPSIEDLVRRAGAGWKLVTLEWERDAAGAPHAAQPSAAPEPAAPLEIPYGLRVSADGFHLEDEPSERRILMIVLNSIVDDRPISQAAADLNRAGMRTREGFPWTPVTVFDLLPRLIEAGPRIFSSADWIVERAAQRKKLRA